MHPERVPEKWLSLRPFQGRPLLFVSGKLQTLPANFAGKPELQTLHSPPQSQLLPRHRILRHSLQIFRHQIRRALRWFPLFQFIRPGGKLQHHSSSAQLIRLKRWRSQRSWQPSVFSRLFEHKQAFDLSPQTISLPAPKSSRVGGCPLSVLPGRQSFPRPGDLAAFRRVHPVWSATAKELMAAFSQAMLTSSEISTPPRPSSAPNRMPSR